MKILSIIIFTTEEISIIVKEINCTENEEKMIKYRIEDIKDPNFIIALWTLGVPQNMLQKEHIEKIIDGVKKAKKIEAEIINLKGDLKDITNQLYERLQKQNMIKISKYQNN
ncbi:MAG: hypothetical protein WC872_00540 [Candidatus Absconditabacterales bacterium]|jgi:hypothetical protein